MSVQAISWAFAIDLEKNYAAKVLLLALANYAGPDGKCFPGRKTISDETGIPERTITRQISLLKELGLVSVERRMNGNKRTSDIYTLHLENSEDANLAHAKSEQNNGLEDANCGVFIKEFEPSEVEPLDECPKPAKRRSSYSNEFEEFWKGYPTDQNMSKKEAHTYWKKLDSEQCRQAIASLPNFKTYCRNNDWYRPIHACRYLKQEKFVGHMEGTTAGTESLEELRAIMQA